MNTIEERANAARPMSNHTDVESYRYGYHHGATEQRKIDYWKARKAFCRTTCGKECPLKDDIEGGGGMVVDCVKLEYFIKAMED